VKLKRTYPYVYFEALILMPVYLFIAAFHLFFVPGFLGNVNSNSPAVCKNIQLVYYLVRNDRSTPSENKSVKTLPRTKTLHKAPVATSHTPLLLTAACHTDKFFQFIADHHYSYLSNQVLRI
jgi:hypothetical protein